jgi:hypothetical protein
MFCINLGAPRAGIVEAAVRARIKIAGLKMAFTYERSLSFGGSMSHTRRAGGNDAFPTILSVQAPEPSKEKYECWQK